MAAAVVICTGEIRWVGLSSGSAAAESAISCADGGSVVICGRGSRWVGLSSGSAAAESAISCADGGSVVICGRGIRWVGLSSGSAAAESAISCADGGSVVICTGEIRWVGFVRVGGCRVGHLLCRWRLCSHLHRRDPLVSVSRPGRRLPSRPSPVPMAAL